jgi:hypothetical protein
MSKTDFNVIRESSMSTTDLNFLSKRDNMSTTGINVVWESGMSTSDHTFLSNPDNTSTTSFNFFRRYIVQNSGHFWIGIIRTAMRWWGDYWASLPDRFSPDKFLGIHKTSKLMNTQPSVQWENGLSFSVISRPVREADSCNLGPRIKMGGTIPPIPVHM